MAKKKITPRTFGQILNDLSTPEYVLGDLSSFTRDDVQDLRSAGGIHTLGRLLEKMTDPAFVWPVFLGQKQLDRITDAALVEAVKALKGNLPKELTDVYELPEGLKTQKEGDSKNNSDTTVVVEDKKPEGSQGFWKKAASWLNEDVKRK
jgi:hypothetical protein